MEAKPSIPPTPEKKPRHFSADVDWHTFLGPDIDSKPFKQAFKVLIIKLKDRPEWGKLITGEGTGTRVDYHSALANLICLTASELHQAYPLNDAKTFINSCLIAAMAIRAYTQDSEGSTFTDPSQEASPIQAFTRGLRAFFKKDPNHKRMTEKSLVENYLEGDLQQVEPDQKKVNKRKRLRKEGFPQNEIALGEEINKHFDRINQIITVDRPDFNATPPYTNSQIVLFNRELSESKMEILLEKGVVDVVTKIPYPKYSTNSVIWLLILADNEWGTTGITPTKLKSVHKLYNKIYSSVAAQYKKDHPDHRVTTLLLTNGK